MSPSTQTSAHPPRNASHWRSGFSLTELLVVLSIIGVLSAIIIAAVGSIKEQAWATKSIGNKRTIYTALSMYHADHGNLPPLISADSETQQSWNTNTAWHTIIAPYLEHNEIVNGRRTEASEVFYDPAQAVHSVRGDYGIGYSQQYGPIKKWLTDSQGVSNPASRSLSFAEINNPGKTPLLADCEAQNSAGEVVGSWYFIMTRTSLPPLSGSPRLSFRHNDRVQFLFADGSSGSYTLDQVYGEDGILPWSNE
ncbi:DUF1559 domain-containing protein [Ruficoccus amylovorans]|uniref:DUF1559 domain-containing protein n=1 Tax=Ruficoccus amylovorans TaxID=1804625 RepID=A0A842HCR3_9BACT|nr:DUF1559 domain-containing protein [Ruficoccus amylovorans]MBC2593486.1 DUF1559 domain-containing protein [Ruficoccus amylovorans]